VFFLLKGLLWGEMGILNRYLHSDGTASLRMYIWMVVIVGKVGFSNNYRAAYLWESEIL
jgi:hypothetical protein